jgi:hypothetical protein
MASASQGGKRLFDETWVDPIRPLTKGFHRRAQRDEFGTTDGYHCGFYGALLRRPKVAGDFVEGAGMSQSGEGDSCRERRGVAQEPADPPNAPLEEGNGLPKA